MQLVLLKAPPPIFCSHTFNFGAVLLCVGDFFQKNSLTPCGEKKYLIGGHDLAVGRSQNIKLT